MSRRILQGIVVSDAGDKTVVVRVERRIMHPIYKKFVTTSKKYAAHDADNRHHIGEAAAGVLERLVQAGKYLSDLAVENAGERVSRRVRGSNLASEPDDPPAFGYHRLGVGPRLRRLPFYVPFSRPFPGIIGHLRLQPRSAAIERGLLAG